jgi:hypothetical protein
MKMKNRWFPRPVAAALLTGLLCWLPAGNQQAQIILFGGSTGASSSTSFQGQASAVSGVVLGNAVAVADSGALAASGGAQEASALEASVASGLAVGACHAAVVGGGNVASAEAAVANVSFTGNATFFGTTTITAEFVMSRAEAICAATGLSINGAVQVTGLVINGQAVVVTGAANQFVFLSDGGYVIINEQLAGYGSVTVNALHVVDMFAGVNLIFGSSTSGINCGSSVTNPPPGSASPCDFVTGGGWITGTPSGAKANFGVAGGIKNGAFWGHLNYIDHGSGMHVKHTAVTGYAFDPNDADCRIIDYNVTIDGQPGTARVRVCDKGEPGRNDIFQIQLSSGYFAGGDLGGAHPGGGNIQLHKCHE